MYSGHEYIWIKKSIRKCSKSDTLSPFLHNAKDTNVIIVTATSLYSKKKSWSWMTYWLGSNVGYFTSW